MEHEIRYSASADKELDRIRIYERRRIVDSIDRNLISEPDVVSRNRKCLGEQMTADFDFVPPLWELRVAAYRAFYTIGDGVVVVHAVRIKPPDSTTQDVLNENH